VRPLPRRHRRRYIENRAITLLQRKQQQHVLANPGCQLIWASVSKEPSSIVTKAHTSHHCVALGTYSDGHNGATATTTSRFCGRTAVCGAICTEGPPFVQGSYIYLPLLVHLWSQFGAGGIFIDHVLHLSLKIHWEM